MKRLTVIIALLICVIIAGPATPVSAQTPTPTNANQGPQAQGGIPMLKITVVISRFSGEKKIGSLPFVLLLMPTEDSTNVQMSSNVPVPQGPDKDGNQTFSYQSVGTSLSASTPKENPQNAPGQHLISLRITDSQMLSDMAGATAAMKGLMRTQQFSSTVRLPLRDAQTISYNAATDKITGDLVRVEVTLNVLK